MNIVKKIDFHTRLHTLTTIFDRKNLLKPDIHRPTDDGKKGKENESTDDTYEIL